MNRRLQPRGNASSTTARPCRRMATSRAAAKRYFRGSLTAWLPPVLNSFARSLIPSPRPKYIPLVGTIRYARGDPVPGIEHKLGKDLDLLAELGLGLNDDSPNYLSFGLAYYLR